MGLETEGSENEKGAEKDESDMNILCFFLVSTVLLFKVRRSRPGFLSLEHKSKEGCKVCSVVSGAGEILHQSCFCNRTVEI